TPRQWFGIVLDGEVETLRGAQARSVVLATHTTGALLGEGAMLGESTHWASAVTHKGASVWQISKEALEEVRRDKPEIFYHIVGRIAAHLNERLRHSAERIAGEKSATLVSSVRNEHDSLGDREVPNHAYYGVQTIRGVENFPLSGIRLYHFTHFVRALAL